MKFKLKKLRFGAGRPVAFVHEKRATKLNIHIGDRVNISSDGNRIAAIVDITRGKMDPSEVYLSEEAVEHLGISPGQMVDLSLAIEPESTRLISKKLAGETLSKEEIYSIIEDIVNNYLTEAEIAYFVSGVYHNGMTLSETIALTEAIFKTGHYLKWNNHKIVDKHSIGGIAGNRTTPIVVSICAAAGVIMPKTSSRAITSAAGTADVIETIANVEFSPNELKKIVNKTGACLVWGGSLGMAPADDKLIRVERLLSLDPESQLISSILAKKLAVGSKLVLIDIPYGPSAKVTKKRAIHLKKKFLKIAKHFKINLKIILTDGSQPIGNGIGPCLEIKDVLKVLKRENPPLDLEKKSIFMAGEILEIAGKAKKGKGRKIAQEILDSGKAYKKFEEIIETQGKLNSYKKTAKFKHNILSKHAGKIASISNKGINHIGRILGSPADKAAGLYIHKHVGDSIKKSDLLLTLHSESKKKLSEALEYIQLEHPIKIR